MLSAAGMMLVLALVPGMPWQMFGPFALVLAYVGWKLLGKVAKLLEKRFAQALKQHIKQQAEARAMVTTEADHTVSTAVPPGSWLMAFRQTLRTALLAELDTRLQPALGLLEAFESQNPQEQ